MLNTHHFRRFYLLALVVLAGAVPNATALQLGARETPEWIQRLEAPERLAGLKTEEVISRLNLKPGLIVADIGAGTGAFSRPLAKAVGPTGKVYAVDIQQGLLDYINQRAKKEKIANIQTVLGQFDDPKLPAHDVDLALINDVLHHIEHRSVYLKALASYLKPNGRIAVIEMDKNDPNTPHRNEPEMLISKDDANQWMAAAGLRPGQEFNDLFPGTKWFIIYGRK